MSDCHIAIGARKSQKCRKAGECLVIDLLGWPAKMGFIPLWQPSTLCFVVVSFHSCIIVSWRINILSLYAIGPLSVCPVCPACLFVTFVQCGQTVGRIKTNIGTQVGLGPGHIVLDGDPAPPAPKGHSPPIFGPYLLRPNGCMDQDVTWYGARPRPRRLCVRWGPRSPSPAHVYCGQTA